MNSPGFKPDISPFYKGKLVCFEIFDQRVETKYFCAWIGHSRDASGNSGNTQKQD